MPTENAAKKYALNTSWILIEKLSRIVSGILVGILVARYLGPEQFGIISYALNVVAIFAVFSSLGMDNILVRELIMRKDEQSVILGTAFTLRLVGAISVVVLTTFYSWLRDNPQSTFIVFFTSLSVVLQSLMVIDFYFQSAVKGKYTAINQVITLAISSVVKIALIYANAPVEYFASMVLFEALLTAINQIFFYKKQGNNIQLWRFSLNEAKTILHYSWPIIATGFVMMLYQKIDQILIKRWLDMVSLGNYAVGIRMSEAALFIPTAICAAVFPGIINARENPVLQQKRLTQLYSIMIWSSIIIAVGATLFGDAFIHFLYKDKFDMAASVFKIHIWSLIPSFYGVAWGMWLFAQNNQKQLLYYQIPNALVMGLCYYYFIPKYGIQGAAFSITLGYIIITLIYIATYKPKQSIKNIIAALNPYNLVEVYQFLRNNKK